MQIRPTRVSTSPLHFKQASKTLSLYACEQKRERLAPCTQQFPNSKLLVAVNSRAISPQGCVCTRKEAFVRMWIEGKTRFSHQSQVPAQCVHVYACTYNAYITCSSPRASRLSCPNLMPKFQADFLLVTASICTPIASPLCFKKASFEPAPVHYIHTYTYTTYTYIHILHTTYIHHIHTPFAWRSAKTLKS